MSKRRDVSFGQKYKQSFFVLSLGEHNTYVVHWKSSTTDEVDRFSRSIHSNCQFLIHHIKCTQLFLTGFSSWIGSFRMGCLYKWKNDKSIFILWQNKSIFSKYYKDHCRQLNAEIIILINKFKTSKSQTNIRLNEIDAKKNWGKKRNDRLSDTTVRNYYTLNYFKWI